MKDLREEVIARLWLFLVVLTLSVRPASGQTMWEPPSELSVQGDHRPTMRREQITRVRVAAFTVILETTTLSAVQSHLGGTIGRRGEAAEAVAWLCFHGRDTGGVWGLWLEAGEVHAETVGAFQLRRFDAATQFDQRCQSIDGSNGGIELPAGLRLGLSSAQTIRILGRPTTIIGDMSLYKHERQAIIRGQPFTVSNILKMRFRNMILEALDVWKMTIS